jgi:glutaminyl-peptide cyclotransferase
MDWTGTSIQWTDTNSTFGSREMAASMALSGDLGHLKAMILADMIGPSNLRIKRDVYPSPPVQGQLESTPWLIDLIWTTAARLGYGSVFIDENYPVGGDDHFSFIRRGVAACDLIDFDVQTTYWHTPEDTLDSGPSKPSHRRPRLGTDHFSPGAKVLSCIRRRLALA